MDTGADTADTGADTSETGHDTADTGADTGDTAVDTGPTIEPLYLEVTNNLDEAIDFLDAADSVSGDYQVLVDGASPMAPGEVRDFLLAEGTWSFYAETPTVQCGSVANVVLGPTLPGYAWDIASLIDCSE